ncbi:MAG: hypothetical protein ACR2OZ_14260 [Verrucomicrobiales bacterium]
MWRSTLLFVVMAGWAMGREVALPLVFLRPLGGSTGGTVTRLLSQDLSHAAGLVVTKEPQAAFVVTGSATGSRVEGELLDPSGSEVMSVIYDGANLKHSAHQFADDVVFAVTQRPGIATSVLAFVSDISGRKEIYLSNNDGSEVRRVSDGGAVALCPSISRDAGFLTYVGYQSGQPDVYFLDLLSGRRRSIMGLPGTSSGAAVSPNGRNLALTVSASGTVDLVIAATDGRIHRHLHSGDGLPCAPTWSPDGEEIAGILKEAGTSALVVWRARNGRPRVIPTGFTHCAEPDWSPDGERLVFGVKEGGEDFVAVHKFGRHSGRLLARGESPCWGADGRHVLFSSGNSLVILNVDTGARRTVVSNMGRLAEPVWTK